MNPPGHERVVATIPVFRAPGDLPARVDALRQQVAAVVLVDDGSGSLPSPAFELPGVEQVALEENSGIAHALNVAVERARDLGATHVLTLDQDSTVPAGYVARMLAALRARAASGRPVAGAVPSSAGGAAVLRDMDDVPFDPIQSGQIIPVPVLDAVGPFAEELFIDAVDSDFWLRADALGYSFAVVDEAEIAHGLGELQPIRIFGRQLVLAGKPRHVLYHSPFRTYYMVRNSTVLNRRYAHHRPKWMRRRSRKMFEMVAGCIILAGDRRSQLRAVRAGRRDARRGVLGKIDPATLEWIMAPSRPRR
ncbi:glycosyltransferase [Microbacterium lushaniae]|nr:glycosyltransferase [Microbacterium lushaniae]KAA9152704.1 glycosyltransferase [Microbacterium lushaniae]